MDTREIARRISAFGNVLIAASLLSALIWWRAGLCFFAAGAMVYALSWVIGGAWGAAAFAARE